MGWLTDWLIPNSDTEARPIGRRVVWTNPIEVVHQGGQHGDTIVGCSACWKPANKCSCDPQLGRPRRWHE
jgi:hypothetical protein